MGCEPEEPGTGPAPGRPEHHPPAAGLPRLFEQSGSDGSGRPRRSGRCRSKRLGSGAACSLAQGRVPARGGARGGTAGGQGRRRPAGHRAHRTAAGPAVSAAMGEVRVPPAAFQPREPTRDRESTRVPATAAGSALLRGRGPREVSTVRPWRPHTPGFVGAPYGHRHLTLLGGKVKRTGGPSLIQNLSRVFRNDFRSSKREERVATHQGWRWQFRRKEERGE